LRGFVEDGGAVVWISSCRYRSKDAGYLVVLI
jgi:hypothetical protein